MHDLDDTIAAVATGPAPAARAVVRISGPRVLECLSRLTDVPLAAPPLDRQAPRVVHLALRVPPLAASIPCELLIWHGTRSYTRQPAAELHLPGSPPIVQTVLLALCDGGARLAEPGEFTLRAFLAGRIDLTQAEAVLGVVDAKSDEQLAQALSQLAGGLAQPLAALRERLLDLVAELEAALDFVEEDLQFVTSDQVLARLDEARTLLATIATRIDARGLVDEVPRVILVGSPNVGKSSLFNRLLHSSSMDAGPPALVSDESGTTRDWLVGRLRLDGATCELVDTAGIDTAGSDAQGESSSASGGLPELARQATANARRGASVEILCLDGTREWNAWEQVELARVDLGPRLVAITKTDAPRTTWALPRGILPEVISTSAITGEGLDLLRLRLRDLLADLHGTSAHGVLSTGARCGESLRRAGEALARATDLANSSAGEELLAAELRAALDEIGLVAGTVHTEDLLDRIFSRFCIGK